MCTSDLDRKEHDQEDVGPLENLHAMNQDDNTSDDFVCDNAGPLENIPTIDGGAMKTT